MSEHPQKIIALVDGSTYSASVCEHAAWVSGRTGASVELIHVLGRREAPERPDLSGAIALGARTALLEELAELDAQRSRLVNHRGRAILEDAHAILQAACVAQITTRLRQGNLIDAVAEAETDASLLMIGKRGEAANFATGHLGSNLERVARSSMKPVFIASRAFRPISNVLVAFDGSGAAMNAVGHIAHGPVFQGLNVHIVTVGAATPEVLEALLQAKQELEAAGIAAETDVLQGQPEEVLAELVDGGRVDLLVMGAYGHSRVRRLILGSTTDAMVRCCKVPIVLIR